MVKLKTRSDLWVTPSSAVKSSHGVLMFPAALPVAAHSLVLSLFRLLALPSRIHQLRQNPQDGRHPVHPAPHPSPLHLLSSISSHHLFFSSFSVRHNVWLDPTQQGEENFFFPPLLDTTRTM